MKPCGAPADCRIPAGLPPCRAPGRCDRALRAQMKDRTFFVSVPADARFLRAIRSFFQPLLTEVFGDATTQMLILALDEACSNMIKHAGDSPAERRIEVHG